MADILEAIRKILSYTEDLSLEAFERDPRTVDAVIRNFIVIGEAARRVPTEIAAKYHAVPWRLMADMRNFAVYEHSGVDLRTVWDAVQRDLPPLIYELETILQDAGAGNDRSS